MIEKNSLKIAIPKKGRLSAPTFKLLRRAGYTINADNKKLFAVSELDEITFFLLRTQDIPTLIDNKIVDAGISGTDILEERQFPIKEALALNYGHCRLCLAGNEQSLPAGQTDIIAALVEKARQNGRQKPKIVTSFPNITRKHFLERGYEVDCVLMEGSVEIMMGLHEADAIADLVETGETLAKNGLKVFETIKNYHCALLTNEDNLAHPKIQKVVKRLKGIMLADRYSIIEYNVEKNLLDKAKKITPGFDTPTIVSLHDNQMFSVKAMVEKKKIHHLIDELERIGATAIFETKLENCRL